MRGVGKNHLLAPFLIIYFSEWLNLIAANGELHLNIREVTLSNLDEKTNTKLNIDDHKGRILMRDDEMRPIQTPNLR